MKTQPRFDETYSDELTLLCPRCLGNNLHHDTVTVFGRNEDAETVTVTTVGSNPRLDIVEMPNRLSGNPSSRRDGLAIRFTCENCDQPDEDEVEGDGIELTVTQHKGCTILKWREV